MSDIPGIRILSSLNDLNSLNTLIGLNDLNSLIPSKTYWTDVSINPSTNPGLLMWNGSSKIHYFIDQNLFKY